MANFQQAYAITMHNEGGYANNKNDSGGETWRGVARNYWAKWPGWAIVDKIKASKPANLNDALAADAALKTLVDKFYEENFWNAIGLPAMNCQQTANQLFDIAVNMGTGTAAKLLQQAINALKPGAVKVDSSAGPSTIEAANGQPDEALYNALAAQRRQRYESIIAANPSQAAFRNSWMSRITPWNSEHIA
ncbi:glycoside hydrolase family 108 protein [Polluticoccus soli]|uniref:glycoside hydrolase family 108 protein n=1 Tax=Polluticoccus soli TaxID=3034150 RepID=UPI0023E2917E|nr:glycosyl hydrolase 108 family protein [Flavipsychrobacter sp. JY13-12]